LTVVEAMIEIPEGSQNKYEWDHTTQRLRLDRVLWGSLHYPTNYGFVPETWADDEDPLDILVFSTVPVAPGVHVGVRLIGGFSMQDEHGPDDKLLGVVDQDPRWLEVTRWQDLPAHRLREIRHFFQVYKALQHIETVVGDFYGVDRALRLLEHAQHRFRLKQSGTSLSR